MPSIQTAFKWGQECILTGQVKAHIVLTDKVALSLKLLSIENKKPMTALVSEAITLLLNNRRCYESQAIQKTA